MSKQITDIYICDDCKNEIENNLLCNYCKANLNNYDQFISQ